MLAKIIDGKKIAEEIKEEVKQKTLQLKSEKGITPGLAFILVGENPASQSYVKSKNKTCEEVGFYSITEKLPSSTTQQEVIQLIKKFNNNGKIHGILVQLPLPTHIDEQKIIEAIDYRKDVDGFHPINVGKLVIGQECLRPCTPAGIQELLMRSGVEISGKHVVVVGRSNIVGKPIANILMQKQKGANAVVTIAHTGAGDISFYTKQADILIAAIGKPKIITGAMIKPGAVVIDVGINRVDDLTAKNGYRIVGDVDFDSAVKVASLITPVPGGVGPMTIAMLMSNTLKAAQYV
ncbi:MAG: bifunctional methylenetetrahydrofolate dehydrogenase/methenyltetrahydrofolate cyclohydrolase FolD [Bacteroidetes bacterium]|nr:bifunctional methylenetetrahydrofolate dehydrogenase/methenyltetrahydrofolate cyclohydrolase FolD [Bacteroidota bacterium]MBU1421649.1 bifunctional methylenetetrahydrofolate dehydrogenase/methenyltetrahydrofolate cyclohydrolase FolD [Bacteroidota bacterium]MBU2471714.1 bifunctional methylenetetrahydrofolate dehydrogenase/methenyltetrahydrofolate cyclohydrolase FolD [Bacteroidota bacterium]MBU2636684.1 bifunctional methylenetetrahydrofolate dehydrogenase/methenyltetrahydrofolate cyclohydrolase